jgi:hypothetical protein
MNKEIKEKIIKAWALLSEKEDPLYPLFHTLKKAKKKRFVEDIGKIEIKIIKILK